MDVGKHIFKTYSEDNEFLNSLLQFAQADGTGSIYAFWLKNSDNNLENSPIVAFGSEGGFHVVSENIKELFQILTYDAEPMIDWDSIFYHKDIENHKPSKYAATYHEWLKDNYQIEITNSADEIVKNAQNKYQLKFKNWVNEFYSE